MWYVLYFCPKMTNFLNFDFKNDHFRSKKCFSTCFKGLIESVSSYLSNTNLINQNDWLRVPKSIMEHNNLEWLLQKIVETCVTRVPIALSGDQNYYFSYFYSFGPILSCIIQFDVGDLCWRQHVIVTSLKDLVRHQHFKDVTNIIVAFWSIFFFWLHILFNI